MRVIPMLLLSAALLAPAAQSMAQTLPGTPPAFTLTQDQLAAMLAQCRAGNCAAGVQQLIALARAAGLNAAEFSAIVATITATLVEAIRNEPALAAQVVEALTVVASNTAGQLAEVLTQIAALIQAGNIDAIDLTAVAAALEDTPPGQEDVPTEADPGSDA